MAFAAPCRGLTATFVERQIRPAAPLEPTQAAQA
jgi:hypothetical protein